MPLSETRTPLRGLRFQWEEARRSVAEAGGGARRPNAGDRWHSIEVMIYVFLVAAVVG
jgi:hypothetical protein